mmetsp:Transcript_18020/g.22708  ORF Transcript_18020/g.22708 Transcript_18020/m.22708 type:complete len:653 (-) Transcript_18020:137-2095(-)
MEAVQNKVDEVLNRTELAEEKDVNAEIKEELSNEQNQHGQKSSKKKKRRRRKKKGSAPIELPLEGCEKFPVKLLQDKVRGRHVVASQDIEAGEVVLESWCYGSSLTVSDVWRSAACHRCLHIVTDTIARCGGCGVAHYCSQKCLNSDLPLHRAECACLGPLLQGMPMEEDSITLRLAARIAALASRDEASGSPLSVSWPKYEHVESLEDHLETIDTHVREELTKASHTIAECLKSHFEVEPSRILHLLLATQCNAHGVRIAHAHPLLALGLFPLGSMLNHSCVPNCHHHFVLKRHQFPVLQFRATTAIPEGAELCYPYTDLFQSTAARKAALKTAYSFDCSCKRCLEEEDDQEEVAVDENLENVSSRPSHAIVNAMISGAVCINSENCHGAMLRTDPESDIMECSKCSGVEPLESYTRRLEEAETRVSTITQVAAKMMQAVSTEGRRAALAAREQCMGALSGVQSLHPYHHLMLKANLVLAQACEVALSESAKENAASQDTNNLDDEQANAERLSLLVDKITAHAATFKAMETCIGGNQPEIASQLYDLGQALSELGFSKLIVPQEKLPELPDVTVDWGDPHAMLGSATQLLQRAQKVYGICLGEDHADTQKAGQALNFIFQMIDQLFKVPSASSTTSQGGKKKRNKKKKKN